MNLDARAVARVWNALVGAKNSFGYDEFVALLQRFGQDEPADQVDDRFAIRHPVPTEQNAAMIVNALIETAAQIHKQFPQVHADGALLQPLIERSTLEPTGYYHVFHSGIWSMMGSSNLIDRVPKELQAAVDRMGDPESFENQYDHKVYALYMGPLVKEE